MYHVRFKGTHSEIGRKWGSGLKAHGVRLLNGVPFPITKERAAFAQECLSSYKKYFPEILEEIAGIEKEQEISCMELHTVLFSMYCIMPEIKCSCFAFRDQGRIILGRNSDFLTAIEKLYMNCIYRFPGGNSYSFLANTTAFVEMEDGVNEAGFAAGLTSVYPDVIKPGLNAGMLLRMGLEKCKNVEEFVSMLKNVPIASSQTFTAADRGGTAALIECNAKQIAVRYLDEETPFVSAVNLFHTDEMYHFNHFEEDNWRAGERYETIDRAFSQKQQEFPDGIDPVRFSMDLLAGKYGFLCQYDRKAGNDTVWSVVYSLPDGVRPPAGNELQNSSVHDLPGGQFYRCEGNPARKKFQKDTRFRLSLSPADCS